VNEQDTLVVAAAAALSSKVRIVKKLLQLVDRNQRCRKMKVAFSGTPGIFKEDNLSLSITLLISEF